MRAPDGTGVAELIVSQVDEPARVTISTCIGCGGMRVYETCDTSCSERRLELVSAGEHEELSAAAAERRLRIDAFLAVIEELEGGEPAPGVWKAAYQALRASARSALRGHGVAARAAAELPAAAETVVVWRCPECGGLDSPQECIGVCIWRPAEWVNVGVYLNQRSRAESDRKLERSLLGILGRLAFTTPREKEWERNWRALRSQAQLIRESARSGSES